jgi:membrane protein DedA with SNARE-associated domain
VLTTLANLHLPLPSELFLPLAGFLVGQGRFSFTLVLAASTAGGVIAALIHYFPGLWIGEDKLRQLFRRIEKYKLLSMSALDRASKAFEGHGGKIIVLGHLIPGVGALISLPAGIKRVALFHTPARSNPPSCTSGWCARDLRRVGPRPAIPAPAR